MPPIPPFPNAEAPVSRRPMLAPLVALAVVALASTLVLRGVVAFPSGATSWILHQTEAGWDRAPAVTGIAETLQVSPAGTVWVLTSLPGGLSRLDGAVWRSYRSGDFGTKASYLWGGFALDGEDVWAATRDGAVHWDGSRWRRYREAVATEDACSVVAGGGRVWVIDRSGHLSQFDGERWTIAKLDLPGVKWATAGAEWPKLARTADGALWLVRDGVWRFDGGRWESESPSGQPLQQATLAGATGDRVWLRDGETLRSVSADGKTWAVYPAASAVNSVLSVGGHIWLATGDGILASEGQGWRRVALPGAGGASVSNIGAGPDGRLWALGQTVTPGRRQAAYLHLAELLAVMLALIGAVIWMARAIARRGLERQRRLRLAVEYATGEAAEELQEAESRLARASSWRGGLVVLAWLVCLPAGFILLHRWWSGAPAWVYVFIPAAIAVAMIFERSLKQRKPRPSDPIGPGAPPRYDWGKTGKALAAGLAVFLLFSIPHVPGYWFLALVLLPVIHEMLSMRLMAGAMKRGDYDAALRILRWSHFYSPQGAAAMRLRGHIQLVAGRYREAEAALRRAIAGLRAGPEQALALEYLGDALMEQGRYDDATRSYRAALHAVPGFRRPYRGLAEMTLRQADNPQQALEYVESVLGNSGLSFVARGINGKPEDDYWSLKSWALAQIGRSGEVAPAIEAAVKATNRKSRPDLAATNYRAGMAMLAIGTQAAAGGYLKRAAEADPRGRWGTLAQAELGQHSVWGGRRG